MAAISLFDRRRYTTALFCLCSFFAPMRVHAWGPHTEITAAALEVIPNKNDLKKYFKEDWQRMSRDYCWMGDWQEAVRPDHYADDYLLYPAMPAHVSHMLPPVRRTYEPFFRRSLQALRTESPREAARWLGSLLHFVQDSGSPPHTAGIGGSLHAKMEQWVDESKISIQGYRPRLLGKSDELALRGFEERMDGLIEFSRQRALKLRPILEPLTKRNNQPLELESALETARVTADLVHTLCHLGLNGQDASLATLAGKFDYQSPNGYARVPAKVMLSGTDFSTTTDADGSFELRNIPPGRYEILVLATGYDSPKPAQIDLKSGATTRPSLQLTPDREAGNLIRNSRLAVRWIDPRQPDFWRRDGSGRWCSALIRVPVGQKCVLRALWKEQALPVFVRWRSNPASLAQSRVAAIQWTDKDVNGYHQTEVDAIQDLKPFEKNTLYLEVLVQSTEELGNAIRQVVVSYVAAR